MHARLSLALVISSLSLVAHACSSGEEPTFRPTGGSTRGGGAEGATTDRGGVAADGERAPEPAGGGGGSGGGGAPAAVTPTPSPHVDPTLGSTARPELLSPASLATRAPDTFAVELDTTEGLIVMDVHRAWAPNGADRFYNLVRAGFYTDVAFFRVLDGFMAQAGIHGDPAVARAWTGASIPDDPVVGHNTRGMVSFAMGGPNTRTTQFFINFADNSRLDVMGFPPFALVREMTAADRLYDGYGEGAPSGRGPAQASLNREGNPYLRASFPELDYIRSARILP